jgi:hypothetical protein
MFYFGAEKPTAFKNSNPSDAQIAQPLVQIGSAAHRFGSF